MTKIAPKMLNPIEIYIDRARKDFQAIDDPAISDGRWLKKDLSGI